MGMFDRLITYCHKCGQRHESQSKAGDCTLTDYEIDNVPAIIAADLKNEVIHCENPACSASYQLKVYVQIRQVAYEPKDEENPE